MGLRSPQEIKQTALRPEASTRFQGAVAPKIDNTFLATASKAISAVEDLRQKTADKYLVEQEKFLSADAENKSEEIRLKYQGELAQQKGTNAIENSSILRDKMRKDLGELVQKYPQGFQQLVQMKADKASNKYYAFHVPYVAGQANKVKDDTYKAQIQNSMNNVVENSASVDFVSNEGVNQVAFHISEQADRMGASPEYKDHLISKGVSGTVLKSIDMQLKSGAHPTAQKLFEANKFRMTAGDEAKALQMFKSAAENEATRTPIDKAMNIIDEVGEDYALADRMAKTMAVDEKERTQIMANIKSHISMKKETDLMQDKKVIATLTEKVNVKRQMPTVQELNQIKDYKVRSAFAKAINDGKGTLGNITDQQVYDDLLEKLATATPEQAKEINLPSYKAFLGSSDYSTLEKLHVDLFKKDTSGKYRASQSDVGAILKDVTVYAAGKKLSRSQTKDFKKLAMEEYNRVRDSNPQYNLKQLKSSVLNRLYEKGLEEKTVTHWFSPDEKKVSGVAKSVDPLNGLKINGSWRSMLSNKYPYASEEQIDQMIININKKLGPEALAKPVSIK